MGITFIKLIASASLISEAEERKLISEAEKSAIHHLSSFFRPSETHHFAFSVVS